MKKHNFKKLAGLGLLSGATLGLIGCDANADKASSQIESGHLMTDSELMSQLNAEGKKTFQSLSPEGKKLALQLASQECKGKNACKGLNACKTPQNECSGKGGCKGTTPGPFTDKNVAVKVAEMAQKRKNM